MQIPCRGVRGDVRRMRTSPRNFPRGSAMGRSELANGSPITSTVSTLRGESGGSPSICNVRVTSEPALNAHRSGFTRVAFPVNSRNGGQRWVAVKYKCRQQWRYGQTGEIPLLSNSAEWWNMINHRSKETICENARCRATRDISDFFSIFRMLPGQLDAFNFFVA